MNKKEIIKKNWGINKKKIDIILHFLGIPKFNPHFIPRKIIKDLDIIISNFINQKILLKSKIRFWMNLKLIKGIRRVNGLPIHGQTVKRNAKTQKRLFKSRLN